MSSVQFTPLRAAAHSPVRPTYEAMALLHPDQPIPSRENSRETSDQYLTWRAPVLQTEHERDVQVKEEPADDDDSLALDAIPAFADEHLTPPRSPSRMAQYDSDGPSPLLQMHHDISVRSDSVGTDDDASRYSSHYSSLEPEAEGTPTRHSHEPAHDHGKETLDDAMQLLSVKDYSDAIAAPVAPVKKSSSEASMRLPTYVGSGSLDFGMWQYMTPSPPASRDAAKQFNTRDAPKPFNARDSPKQFNTRDLAKHFNTRDAPISPKPLNTTPKQFNTRAAQLLQQPVLEPPKPYEEARPVYDAPVEISPPGTPESVVKHGKDRRVRFLETEQVYQDDELTPEPSVDHELSPEVEGEDELSPEPDIDDEVSLEPEMEDDFTPAYDVEQERPTTPETKPESPSQHERLPEWEQELHSPETPNGSDILDGPETPDRWSLDADETMLRPLPMIPDTPDIPERRSTIKTGGRLKARPSVTPADMESMAVQRRLVSFEHPMPLMPSAYRAALAENGEEGASGYSSDGTDAESVIVGEAQAELPQGTTNAVAADAVAEEKSTTRRESRKMRLDLPQLDASEADDLGLGMDAEFDKVIEENHKVRTTPAPAFPPPHFARFEAGSQPQRSAIYSTGGAPYPHDSAEASVATPFSPHTTAITPANLYTRMQKGYLMRQNTKLVVASNRNFSGDSGAAAASKAGTELHPFMAGGRISSATARKAKSANGSPRKPSMDQFLVAEPWNGKTRRKSVRNASAQMASYAGREPAPPLPGQECALGVVDEDFAAGTSSLDEEVGEGVERGRLFVKVVGVKDLELPMPKNERVSFQLTLDNGLHCVTTAKLELGKDAPIGQEFELVVLNDLEFQLTLTTKLPPPPAAPTPVPSSPTKSSVKSAKQSAFSRLLTSPRKRAERERQERDAADTEERRLQEEAQRKRASRPLTSWDLLHDLVNASDGAFARAYINLQAHEPACFGRKLAVDVPCYNEWALERDTAVMHSVRSKKGAHHGAGPIRRPPYVVGKLALQLLYVPKPRGAGDEDMPKSMESAVRAMAKLTEAERVPEISHEGHLGQQGGDCAHWRRRFFRLQGVKLTAYHEHTHQKRAVINLTKAGRLVDDKSLLRVAEAGGSGKAGGGRRKSAFVEEDEGYAYVEEGFRVRFKNGECIDFYADSRAEKEGWMEVLGKVMGQIEAGGGQGAGGGGKEPRATWTDLVVAREKAEGASAGAGGAASAGAAASTATSTAASAVGPAANAAASGRGIPITTAPALLPSWSPAPPTSKKAAFAPAPASPSNNKENIMGPAKHTSADHPHTTKPAAVNDPFTTAPSLTPTSHPLLERRQSAPGVARRASRSAPTSPAKTAGGGVGGMGGRVPVPLQSLGPGQVAQAQARARTPAMGQRRGGRARDAVKSMIF
ncbi:hypothetical protein LTR08_006684 [Meristemomyces frigidus]|nr:hypothetical protein LTR08_006684 [Meristemomyces frigidus]